jgi:predicted amidohydrolase
VEPARRARALRAPPAAGGPPLARRRRPDGTAGGRRRGQPGANRRRHRRPSRGIDLFVLPELAVCGSITDEPTAARLAEPVPGPCTEQLRRLAAEHGTTIIAGLAEVDPDDPGRRFNSAVIVGPDGLIGRYRKLHLDGRDRAWATPGDGGLPTFDLPLGRVGLLIGYDALFPEAARVLALNGADLLACPSLVEWAAGPGVGRDRGADAGPRRCRADRRPLPPLAGAGAGEQQLPPVRQRGGSGRGGRAAAADGLERLLRPRGWRTNRGRRRCYRARHPGWRR